MLKMECTTARMFHSKREAESDLTSLNSFGTRKGAQASAPQCTFAHESAMFVTPASVSDSETLPLVVPQMDWPEGRNKRPKKAKYLTTLKRALSGFTVEWASWRRFSDLPDPEDASPCDRFTETSIPQLKHPIDYCGSGMVDQYGTVEDADSVFLTLTTD